METLKNLALFGGILAIPVTILWYMGFFKELIYKLFLKEKYISKRLSGKITFDYSNNNGLYKIGKNRQFFELKFTKASDTSIHIYNDPLSIKGIAIVKGIFDIGNIKDATIYDISSRVRTVNKGEIIILKNIEGNYCALKILDIKDDSRSDNKDEITFEYIINGGGYTDFRK